jgi:hypothetical protein
MDFDLNQISKFIRDLSQVILDLHVLALLLINVTETPRRQLRDSARYSTVKPFYRVIELLAGLITPRAKQ